MVEATPFGGDVMRQTLMRWLPNLCLLFAFGLLGLAGYLYFVEPDESVVAIEESERLITAFAAGEKAEVVFRIGNHTGQTARVVGLGEC